MTEPNTSRSAWQGPERRTGAPPTPQWGELLVESAWRPTDKPVSASDGWLRANGYAPDRRTR